MERIFTWKYEKVKFATYRICISEEGKLFGVIPYSDLDGVSRINNKGFYLDSKKDCIIRNAETDKVVGEAAYYSDGSRHIEVNNKSKYLLYKGYNFKDNLICQFDYETGSRHKSGVIKINSDSDIELIIYALFYFEIPRD